MVTFISFTSTGGRIGRIHAAQQAMTKGLQVGDYVFATKWHDGDPCDPHAVGFISKIDAERGRVIVSDAEGNVIYGHNGFRRAKKITAEEGQRMLAIMRKLSDRYGPSMWGHLKRVRSTLKADAEEKAEPSLPLTPEGRS
jgi:hypothetical protein